jgi:hypothetical protein
MNVPEDHNDQGTEQMQTPEEQLATLRLSLRRVAECANQQGAEISIPDLNIPPKVERGWNRLCADLMAWMEEDDWLIDENVRKPSGRIGDPQ